jgi:TonB family protein
MKRFTVPLMCWIVLGACSNGQKVFVPRSDYGIAPQPERFTEPGDCHGGSQLAGEVIDTPEYPRGAFNRGQQGWVVLRLDVDGSGKPRRVRVVEDQPSGVFSAKARSTVARWRFAPPVNGSLYDCIVVIDYRLGQASIGR